MTQTQEHLDGHSETAPAGGSAVRLPAHRYTAARANDIEAKWRDRWDALGVFHAPNPVGELSSGFERCADRPKKFVLDMFPYPSGVGLHVGHPLGYIATDIYARYMRMSGCNVLHAMGFDAFGLPAEQYAMQTGQHPRATTEQNIATMRRQLRRLGLGHDERRSVATTDVAFYRWTQWIFLQIFNAWYDEEEDKARPIDELIAMFASGRRDATHPLHNPQGSLWSELSQSTRRRIIDECRLAYLSEQPVNWCPALGTVLANEEVTADGRSERGDHPVSKRPLKQWMLRITAYAERLLRDLDSLDWPEPIKHMQRNWIGRSEGARIHFPIDGADASIEVFTTRPDTIFGATYMVLAPEHPLVDAVVPQTWPEGVNESWLGEVDTANSPADAVAQYRAQAAALSDVQRQERSREKTGVFTGAFATNPASREKMPIFIADYVLMGYGSGAIMAVPAHDDRDYDFAQTFDLPIVDVVYPRTIHAIRWFVERSGQGSLLSEDWKQDLADFLGLVVNHNLKSESYSEAIETVLTRRRGQTGPSQTGMDRRGAIRAVWIETIGALALRGIAGLREEFMNRSHWATLGEAFTEPGVAVNSPPIEGLTTPDAKRQAIEWLESRGAGERSVAFKLRDWLFSRQRYWGEPFPIVYDEAGDPLAVPESMLPVELPPMENFAPETHADAQSDIPEPPLGRARSWATVTLDLGDGPRTYRRELNTMPQWAGSCWYYLRYLDPSNDESLCDPVNERYWMAGELSSGGAGVSPACETLGDADVSPAFKKRRASSFLRSPRMRRRNLPHLEYPGGAYLITFRTRNHQLTDDERQIVLDACRHWHGQRMFVHIVTVMTDHVHMLATPLKQNEDEYWSLDALMQSVKSFSSHEINEHRKTQGTLWQNEYHDRLIRDEDEFHEKWRYIATNPVRAGIAQSAEAHRFTWSPGVDEQRGRDARATIQAKDLGDAPRENRHFGGVDLYVGGVEHAVLHLLYARFWHKALFDLGVVSTPEPFQTLFNQGYIQAYAYRDKRGVYVEAEEVVEEPQGSGKYLHNGEPVTREFGKMGKSLKNALTPDDICRDFGADTLRLYEMYMGPLEQSKPWNTRDIIGVHRFLQRVWRNIVDEETGALRVVDAAVEPDLLRHLHQTIAGVHEDMENLRFNTAIAKMMAFNNALVSLNRMPREAVEALVLLLAPLAPHIAEELWERLGHSESLVHHPMPVADAELAKAPEIEIPVQVMGKVRSRIIAQADSDEETIKKAALADTRVQSFLEGKSVRKIIVAPGGKLVNIVTG